MKAFPLAVILFILAASLALAGCTGPAKETENAGPSGLTYYTEQYPPNNYIENGTLRGIAVDLLVETTGRMGSPVRVESIRVVPWTEGYKATLAGKNAVLFSTQRLPERESQFKWAGPIATGRKVLFARADSNISITKPGDLAACRIGVVTDDSAIGQLAARGVDPKSLAADPDPSVVARMLLNGKVDLFAYGQDAGEFYIRKAAGSTSAVTIVYQLSSYDLYYAFSRDVPDSTISAFQKALDEVKSSSDSSGTTAYRRIIDRYTEPAGTLSTAARYANLTRFVQGAAAYAKEHGKEAALKEFNNVNGTFISGDLYVFAYDMNGNTLALPFQKDLLGTDRRGITDSNGVKFIDRMIGLAREGGGSLYYIYKNPEDNYREEFKISYVLPVDSEWFVGSGIYLPHLPAGFNVTERDGLVARVKQAREYAQVQGAAKAIADFNDRNGTFADGSRYIFAYGYDGTTLALPFQPEVIGTNRMNFSDPYGVNITPWEIAVAQRGGGFVYVDYFNPDTGGVGMKLCYVAPVDKEWLVGSGIYTEGL